MSEAEVQKMVAAHEEAICTLKADVSDIKKDLREALRRWPPGLAAAVTVLSSVVTGLSVYIITH